MTVSSMDQTKRDISWASRWYELLNAWGYDLDRGQSFIRRDLVQSVDVQSGRILAQMNDPKRGMCALEIEIVPFRDQEWTAVLDALAGEAIYAAQLLAGDMPAAIESVFASAHVSLLPLAADDLNIRCRVCEHWEQPCKHAVAVLYLHGQMIANDPWLLFQLRGRNRQQVLESLRQRRRDTLNPSGQEIPQEMRKREQSATVALGTLQGPADGTHLPLAAQIDTFWGNSAPLRALHHHINPPSIRLALLRRLGPPPFSQESMETYNTLAQIYQQVSAKALDLAFAPQSDEDSKR